MDGADASPYIHSPGTRLHYADENGYAEMHPTSRRAPLQPRQSIALN